MKKYLLTLIILAALLHSQGAMAQPPNDNCWQADTVLVPTGSTVTVTGNNEGATDALGLGVAQVWEAFTVTECVDLTISYCGTTPAFQAAHRTLYLGCDMGGFSNHARHPDTGITQTDCPDGNFTIPYFQLPAGTYFYMVEALPGSIGDYTLNFTASPCAATPPVNDECPGAITLVPNSTCVTVTGDVDGANAGVSLDPITCNGWTGASSDDVWFQFVATAAEHTIIVTPSTSFDATVDLRSGICGATQNINCAEVGGSGGEEIVNATGLTVGETYYVRVYDWWAGLALTTTFDICIIGPGGGDCEAFAGTFTDVLTPTCLVDGSATLIATPSGDAVVPAGYSTIYLLTMGEELVYVTDSTDPGFIVNAAGTYTIHTLVYSDSTFDVGSLVADSTTGADIYALLVQGGGEICGSIDVTGATFEVVACDPCEAFAGTLTPVLSDLCLIDGVATLEAIPNEDAVIPTSLYQQVYVLTQGTNMVILEVSITPVFDVTGVGEYTIHSLVFNPETLNLSDIVIGSTTAAEVNAMLQQGGGTICASLDLVGASYMVQDCTPVNDLCSNAQGLNIYMTGDCEGNEFSGSNIFSTFSDVTPSCDPSDVGYADVWYIFNSGTNTQVFIEVDSVTMAGWGVAVYMDCLGGDLVACEAAPTAPMVLNTTPDTDYLVMVYSDLQDGQTGDFEICLTAAEAVNFCLGGTVSTNLGEDEITICTNDPTGPITLISAGVAAQNYTYILTDTTGMIIEVLTGNMIDFADDTLGMYQIYGVSFNGTLAGATPGAMLADVTSSGECISISENSVTVTVEICTAIGTSTSMDWNLFPNPTNGEINIHYAGPSGNALVELTDMSGRIVASDRIQLASGQRHSLTFDGTLAPGMYNVTLTNGEGRSTARLIIE